MSQDAFRHIGVIVGFAREASCLKRHKHCGRDVPLSVAMSGAEKSGALKAAQTLIDGGIDALMSFGVAGGLQDDVAVGDVVFADKIYHKDGVWMCHKAWSHALWARYASVPFARRGSVFGSDILVPEIAEKRALGERTGALVVDMESHIGACLAHRHGIPFMAVRAVVDRVDKAIPPVLYHVIAPDGSYDVGGVMKALLRRPWQVGSLISLAYHMERAESALVRVIQRGLF